MRHPAHLAIFVAFLLLPTGCGVLRSATAVSQARLRYEAALTAGVANRAPYEFTLGEEYLRKALEENGHSDYSNAERLAQQARALLAEAERKANNPDAGDLAPLPQE